MKRFLAILLLLLATRSVEAQTIQFLAQRQFTATAATADVGLAMSSSGVAWHQISWVLTGGTLSGCSVKLQQSSDNATWSDLIAAQTCTSNGQSAATNVVASYVRINVTVFTQSAGTPSLAVSYFGYSNNPVNGGGAGTITATSSTTNILTKFTGATSIGNSAVSDNGTTVTSTEPVVVNTGSSGFPGVAIAESTNACPSPSATQDFICANSTNHLQISIAPSGAYFTPADTAGTFTAAGSLTGTNTSQQVVGITTIQAGPTTNSGSEVWLCKAGCTDTSVNNWITNENPSVSQAWIVHDEVCGDTITANPFVNGGNPLIVDYKLATCKAALSTPTWVTNVPIQITSNNQRIEGLGGSMASGGVGKTGNSGIVLGQTFPLGVPQAPILPTTGSTSGASTVAFVANGVSGCNTNSNTTGFATGVNYYVVEEYANTVGPTNQSQELGPISQSSGNFECMTVTEPTNGNANATNWMVLATPTAAPSSGSEESDGTTTYAKGSGTETIQAPPALNGTLGPVNSNMTQCMIVLGHTWADGTPNTINSDYVGGIALDGDGAYGSEGICNLAAQENTNLERNSFKNFGGVSPTLGTDGAGHVIINSVTYTCSSARPCFFNNSVEVEEGNTNRTPGANNSALDGANLGDSDCSSTTARPWSHCKPNGAAADITLPSQPTNLVMSDNVNSLRWIKNLTATPNTNTGPNNMQCQVLAIGIAGNNALQSSLLEALHLEGTSTVTGNLCMQGWRGTIIHPNGGSSASAFSVTADANSFNYAVLDADPGTGGAISDTAQSINATQFPAGKSVSFWATGDKANTFLSPYFASFNPMTGSTAVALSAKGDGASSDIFRLFTNSGTKMVHVDNLGAFDLGAAGTTGGTLNIAGATSGAASLTASAAGGGMVFNGDLSYLSPTLTFATVGGGLTFQNSDTLVSNSGAGMTMNDILSVPQLNTTGAGNNVIGMGSSGSCPGTGTVNFLSLCGNSSGLNGAIGTGSYLPIPTAPASTTIGHAATFGASSYLLTDSGISLSSAPADTALVNPGTSSAAPSYTASLPCGPLDTQCTSVDEEFFGGIVGTTAVASRPWFATTIVATGCTTTFAAGAAPNLGILQLVTPAVSTDGCGFALGAAAEFGVLTPASSPFAWTSTWIFKSPASIASNNASYRIGFTNSGSSSAVPTNGIYVRYDSNLGTPDTTFKFVVCNACGGTETVASDSAVTAAASTWYKVTMTDIVAGVATAAEVVFNLYSASGALLAGPISICGSGCTTTGTPPTAALTAGVTTATGSSGAAQTLQLDKLSFRATGLAR